jgi:hypothetical protein
MYICITNDDPLTANKGHTYSIYTTRAKGALSREYGFWLRVECDAGAMPTAGAGCVLARTRACVRVVTVCLS